MQAEGFSPTIVDTFFRPFLGGIFFDNSLGTSSRLFQFVMRMLATGSNCLPKVREVAEVFFECFRFMLTFVSFLWGKPDKSVYPSLKCFISGDSYCSGVTNAQDIIIFTYAIQGGIGAVAMQMASRLPPGCVELNQKVEKVSY